MANNNRRNTSTNNLLGKIPPQVLELEEAVLGALMVEKDAIHDVVDVLRPESFYKSSHQEIYRAIFHLFSDSEPIDMLTVTQKLRSDAKLELAGGPAAIMRLTSSVNSAANIEYHSRIITEQAIKRELIAIASEMQKEAFEDTTDVFELLDQAEQKIFSISENNIRKNYSTMSPLVQQAIKEIESRRDLKDGLTGIPTGFTDLDRVTGGWQKSDLVIIAARPGMGKCLGLDTPVLMYDGAIKKVQDIEVGDLLMGDDSKPRKVLSLARGKEDMYWVRQNKAMDYRVNASHILSLKRSRNEGKHQQEDILDIELKDYIRKSEKFQSNYKGYKVAVEFKVQKIDIAPYDFGFALGQNKKKQPSKSSTLSEGSPTSIPNEYLVNSTQNRLELLAGLLDSDGHYSLQSNVYEITQTNKKLAEQIKFLCDSLGFRTSLISKKASIRSRNYETQVYRVRIYGDVDKIPLKVERKKARQWQSVVDWRQTGVHIEYDKVDDYYGFEIDGNRRFLLADGTVTHNTAFSLSVLRNAAVDFGQPVAFFSLEMADIQLVNRLISSEAKIASDQIKSGQLEEAEFQRLYHNTKKISDAPIFIDDTPALTVLEFRAKCRRLKQQHDIQLVVLDYLQLMSGGNNSGTGNREQEIAHISRSLKQVAKELNIPVIALSQLSRAVETRGGDKRPQLSDLRESGSIEQDADMVMFLYRPEYYGITQDMEGNPTGGMGEVIIAKHRNGKLADIKLKFIGQYTKFDNLNETGFGDSFSSGTILSSKANDLSSSNGTEGGKRLEGDPPF